MTMPLLLAPTVVGPLSPLTTAVRVTGQRTGSTVTVACGGQPVIASATATSPNQVFPLDPGTLLTAGLPVTATQALSGFTTSGSSPAVSVDTLPSSFGTVTFSTTVYECGQVVSLAGAVPGATVHVGVQTGGGFVERGNAVAQDGTAQVLLNQPTGPTDILIAYQSGGQLPDGPKQQAAHPQPPDKAPPTPVVQQMIVCERTVTVTNGLPGGSLTLKRNSQGVIETGFALWADSTETIWLDSPVQFPEGFTVELSFPQPCAVNQTSASVDSDPLADTPAPKIIGKPRQGAPIEITDLLPGAQVELFVNKVSVGFMEAPAKTMFLNVPAGLSGSLFVKQEQCNWSVASNTVTI